MKCDLCNRRHADIVASFVVGHPICWLCYISAMELKKG